MEEFWSQSSLVHPFSPPNPGCNYNKQHFFQKIWPNQPAAGHGYNIMHSKSNSVQEITLHTKCCLALCALAYTQSFFYSTIFNEKNHLIQDNSLWVLTVHPAILLTFAPELYAEELDSVSQNWFQMGAPCILKYILIFLRGKKD